MRRSVRACSFKPPGCSTPGESIGDCEPLQLYSAKEPQIATAGGHARARRGHAEETYRLVTGSRCRSRWIVADDATKQLNSFWKQEK